VGWCCPTVPASLHCYPARPPPSRLFVYRWAYRGLVAHPVPGYSCVDVITYRCGPYEAWAPSSCQGFARAPFRPPSASWLLSRGSLTHRGRASFLGNCCAGGRLFLFGLHQGGSGFSTVRTGTDWGGLGRTGAGDLYVPVGALCVPIGALYVPIGTLYVPKTVLYVPQVPLDGRGGAGELRKNSESVAGV